MTKRKREKRRSGKNYLTSGKPRGYDITGITVDMMVIALLFIRKADLLLHEIPSYADVDPIINQFQSTRSLAKTGGRATKLSVRKYYP